jgi:hypothetical protein
MSRPLEGHHQAKIFVYNIKWLHNRIFNSNEVSVYNSCLLVAVQCGLIIKWFKTVGLLRYKYLRL